MNHSHARTALFSRAGTPFSLKPRNTVESTGRGRRLPRIFRGALLLGALASLLPGCASSPEPRYYTLDSGAPLPSVPASPPAAAHPASLGVSLVQLPREYLRPQIVTRSGGHVVEVRDLHRWAGALDEDITRALARRLSERLGETVIAAPWSAQAAPTRQLTVVIDRLDGTPGGPVALAGRWRMSGPAESWQPLAVSRTAAGADISAYVAALEGLVSEAAEAIARALRH